MMFVSKAIILEITNSKEWRQQMSVEESLCQTQTEISQSQQEISQKETSQSQKEISQKETSQLQNNILIAIKVLENVKKMLQFIKKPGTTPNNQERFIRIRFNITAGGDTKNDPHQLAEVFDTSRDSHRMHNFNWTNAEEGKDQLQ